MNNKTLLVYGGCLAALAGLFYLTHSLIGLMYIAIGEALGAAGVLIDSKLSPKYIHTPLFLITLLPLSIFVASSTGNTIGQGLVCSLLIGLYVEMATIRHQPDVFNQRFMNAQKPWQQSEIQKAVWVFGVITGAVCAITVF